MPKPEIISSADYDNIALTLLAKFSATIITKHAAGDGGCGELHRHHHQMTRHLRKLVICDPLFSAQCRGVWGNGWGWAVDCDLVPNK